MLGVARPSATEVGDGKGSMDRGGAWSLGVLRLRLRMTPLLKKVAKARAKARANTSASTKANAKIKANAGILHYVQNDGGEGCFSMSRMTDEVEKIFS